MMWKVALVGAFVIGCGGSSAPSAMAPAQLANTDQPRSPAVREEPLPVPSRATARWVRELDNPQASERAISELELAGDATAIEPLGRLWVAQDRPPRVMQVIIVIAKRAGWDRALPYLTKAIADVDEAQPRTVDSAVKAADAIGDAQLAAAAPALITLVKRAPTKRSFVVQIAAIRALGKLEGARAPVSAALIELLGREPPPHPRTAQTREQARQLEEAYSIHLASAGAAVNALGALRSDATGPLLLRLYRTPELAMQIRRALAASGPGAADEVRKVLRGEHVEVNRLIKDKHLDRYCGDKDDLPAARCESVSIRDFYAAVVLGDLHDVRAVPDLLAALQRPSLPAYYMDDQPGPPQHIAIFDALRKLGAAEAAPALRAMWSKRGDPPDRIGAMAAYAFVARDDAGVKQLDFIASDNQADDGLRQEAATAFARLATDSTRVTTLLLLARRYLDASAQKRAAADGKPKRAADVADAELAKAKLALDAAKAKLLTVTRDSSATADQIRAQSVASKQVEDDFKLAKKRHRDQIAEYKGLDGAAKAYLGYARMFQTHVARIAIALRCKQDLACYAASLSLTSEEAARGVAPFIKDVDTWTADEKRGLVEASVDRAMLELGKHGGQAEAFTEPLLDHVASDSRMISQAILLALPKLAKLPCPSCVTKLDAAIKQLEGKATLTDVVLELTVLRSYFEWAK